MKHTALIVSAGSGSGAHFVAPFLLPAIRHAAACCESIREVTEGDVPQILEEAQGPCLLLSDTMPLIKGADCRLLLETAVKLGRHTLARGGEGAYPRCFLPGATETQRVDLSRKALCQVQGPKDLPRVLKTLYRRKAKALMEAGVVILDPRQGWIDPKVRIGPGTVVHPGCILQGDTAIGVRCTLLPGCRLEDATIGDDTTIEQSVLLRCAVGNKSAIGPFAYVRPGTCIGDHCRVGDFVEIKNSHIGDGTKISHLTYVGDSDLGRDINLGCGVVFVNYDGKQKQRSTVADGAFIGCNVNLIAPVHVGEGAYVAAGSTLTEDVPPGALAIARARQTHKENWATKRKMEGKL